MNDTIHLELKVLVERVVRPVRASASRKRMMREELLAHVTAMYEDEAKVGDEKAALERTRLRFGDAAALTGELQSTVSTSDVLDYGFERLVALRRGESTLRRACRQALQVGAFILLALMVACLTRQQSHTWQSDAWILGSIFLAVCSAVFVYTFLSCWLRQALFDSATRSWLRGSAVVVAAWLAIPLLVFGVRLEFDNGVWSILRDALVTLPLFVVIPLLAAMCARDSAAQARDLDEWANLKIE